MTTTERISYLKQQYNNYNNTYDLTTDLLCDCVTDNYKDLIFIVESIMDFTDRKDILNAWNDYNESF